MTAMRSDMVSASSWSWVTKMKVMPVSCCSLFSSIRISLRSLKSSADSGSSSSSTFGWWRQRAGQRHALLLAAGKLAGAAAAQPRHLDQRQHLVDACLDLGLRLAQHLQAEADVLRHRHVGEQGIALEHGVDRPLEGRQRRDVLRHEAGSRPRSATRSRRSAAAAWSCRSRRAPAG